MSRQSYNQGSENLGIIPAGTAAIQRKTTVGAANNPLEHQADAMADKVMRMPEAPLVQRKAAGSCGEYDDEHVRLKPLSSQVTPFIQAKSDGAGIVSNSVSNRIQSSIGGGSPMQNDTKNFMESRFGTDFSDVKIHNGSESAELNRSLSAKAFTVSNNIYFNSGQYQPETESGKHLLAHELTHVVQQSKSIQPKSIQRKFIATGSTADFINMVNQILAVQQRLTASATGEISIQSTNVQGPPTRDATELLNTIRTVVNDARTTTIDFIHGATSTRPADRNVIVGNYAQSAVDLDDVAVFGFQSSHSEMGDNAAVELIHEITEQYRKQVHHEAFPVAHQAGYAAQERLMGARLVNETPMTPIAGTSHGSVTTTYAYPGGRIVDVTTTMDMSTGQIIGVTRAVH